MLPLDTARHIFAADRYATALTGIVLEAIGDHTARCTLRLGPDHRNARGAAMGGVLFTLADFAAAVAANSGCDDGELQWVSLDATVHYLSPATGQRLVADCRPLKVGRQTALLQTTVADPDSDRTVAIVETTMMHL